MTLPSSQSAVYQTHFYQLCERGSLGEIESVFIEVGSLPKEVLNRGLLICCKHLQTLGDHNLIVKLLIQKGGNVNFQEPETGMTPLIYAVQKNSYDISDYLNETKADFSLADKSGKSALVYLLESAEPMMSAFALEVVQKLSREQLEVKGAFPLILVAVQNDQTQVVREMVDKGVGLDVRDPLSGDSLLHKAAARENAEIVTLLLKRGLKNAGNQNRAGKIPSDLTKNPAVLTALKSTHVIESKASLKDQQKQQQKEAQKRQGQAGTAQRLGRPVGGGGLERAQDGRGQKLPVHHVPGQAGRAARPERPVQPEGAGAGLREPDFC